VVAAVAEQVELFTHTCFQVTPYLGYVEVCERLNQLTPGAHEKRTFLMNSGAEAVENAVKVARYATGRSGVVATGRPTPIRFAAPGSWPRPSTPSRPWSAQPRSRVLWSSPSPVRVGS
jgi:hypothetical protein